MTEHTWVTVAEAVQHTGKSERTIRRITAEHDIEARQNGRSVQWNLADIRRAIQLRKWGGPRHAA